MTHRVVFLITDLDLGGMPLILQRIVRGLKELGQWEPTVVSIKPPGIVGHWIRHKGCEVIGLNAQSSHDLNAVRRWVKTLRKLDPPVVVSTLVHANALAALTAPMTGSRLYFQSIHTLQSEPRWLWRLQGLISGQCEGVITPSHAVLQRVAQFGRFNRGYVIPCGLDYEKFAAAEAIPATQRPWPANARVIGYIGRFDSVKRLDRLVSEFAGLLTKDYHQWSRLYLALIGYGPEEKPLRALAAKLGIASHLVFPGATAEPERWYKTLEVLCMPSTVEGFGMNIIEAMACGTPVVACRGAAVKEIATDQLTALLVDPETPGSMAEAVAKLLQDKTLAGNIRNRAQKLVAEHYQAQRMVEKYQMVLDQAIAGTVDSAESR
ncbi:MAG: glycosyltransferase [Planctomycetes bacterium]|nr:glycosyltransferase [Planctomycetota bacterium]